MSSPNMNMRPYIGEESGIQLVPEPSRVIGSARSMVECVAVPAALDLHGPCICACGASLPAVDRRGDDGRTRAPWRGRSGGREFDVERWTPARDLSELDVRRFFSFSGTSFIPHFGQFPG